jgi:hypothetical protein
VEYGPLRLMLTSGELIKRERSRRESPHDTSRETEFTVRNTLDRGTSLMICKERQSPLSLTTPIESLHIPSFHREWWDPQDWVILDPCVWPLKTIIKSIYLMVHGLASWKTEKNIAGVVSDPTISRKWP